MSGSIRSYIRRSFVEQIAAHRMMAVIVILMIIANFLLGERVQAGGGLGWDGVTYANLVRHIDDMIRSDMLGTYYAQRIVPALVVRTGLLALQLPLTDHNIISAFAVVNGVSCVALVDVWRRICGVLDFDVKTRWLGFTGLFINFEFSKQNMYYPVLTDITALLLSAILLLLYLNKNRFGILIVSVIGAFCWPTLSVTGAILVLFMRETDQRSSSDAPERTDSYPFNKWAIAFIGLALLAMLVTIANLPVGNTLCGYAGLLPGSAGNFSSKLDLMFGAHEAFKNLCLPVQKFITAMPSCLLAAIAVYVMCRPMLELKNLQGWFSRYRVQSVGLVLMSSLGLRWIANPAVENPSSIVLLAKLTLFPAPGKVLLPLVSLAVFWGPFLVLAGLSWPKISAACRNLGPGMVVAICFTLPFGLVGEPRFLTTIWPMLVVLTASVLGRSYPDRLPVVLLISSFVFAQFWLPLNLVPWPVGDGDGLQEFPKQLYFMHYGLWMGWPGYVIQSAMITVTAMFILKYLKRSSGTACSISEVDNAYPQLRR
jgi:hypothetical protein